MLLLGQPTKRRRFLRLRAARCRPCRADQRTNETNTPDRERTALLPQDESREPRSCEDPLRWSCYGDSVGCKSRRSAALQIGAPICHLARSHAAAEPFQEEKIAFARYRRSAIAICEPCSSSAPPASSATQASVCRYVARGSAFCSARLRHSDPKRLIHRAVIRQMLRMR